MTAKPSDDNEIDLLALVQSFWAIKRYWIIGGIIGGMIALIPCFLIRPQWSSSALFVSSGKGGGAGDALSSLASLAGFGGAASAEGKEMFYEQILQSRDFLAQFVNKKWDVDSGETKTIQELFRLELGELQPINKLADIAYLKEEASVGSLRESIVYSKGPSGEMTLSVTVPDPVAARQILDSMITALQQYNSRDVLSKAKKERLFAESQLQGFEKDLEIAENRLTSFRRNNISLNSPILEMEHVRLIRNLDVASALVIEFRKQLELAKLNEEKSKDFIDVIQKPSVPIKKSKPERRKIVMAGLFLGGLLGFLLGLILTLRRSRREQLSKELRS